MPLQETTLIRPDWPVPPKRFSASALADQEQAEGRLEFSLEENQPLSQSRVWQWQRRFFEKQGIGAWREGFVPYYITTNPFIARAYAQVVFGFLQDWAGGAPSPVVGPASALNPAQPVYIIELGAGSGHFAFHFLKSWRAIQRASARPPVPVKYIMTDFSEATLEFWHTQLAFEPFIEEGLLDFALFDAEQPQPLQLSLSGQTLLPPASTTTGATNPVVVLANYFFDGLPQDVFYMEGGGRLAEGLVSVSSPQPEPDPDDPAIIERMQVAFQWRPLSASQPYYARPALNQLLQTYRAQLTEAGSTALSFPKVALECLGYFRELAGDRLLILTGDRGYSQLEDVIERAAPDLTPHGSFSMLVNYHALAQYVTQQGGLVLNAPYQPSNLTVLGFCFGLPAAGDLAETRRAYQTFIEEGGPADFYVLKKGVEKNYAALSLPEILGYLRLSGWDSNIFLGCYPVLLAHLDSASPALRQKMGWIIQQVWDTYYPMGETPDLPLHLALLLCHMGCYAEGLAYYERSLQLYGPSVYTLYNKGICHWLLGEKALARHCMLTSLTLDPAFEPARAMLLTIQAEIRLGA